MRVHSGHLYLCRHRVHHILTGLAIMGVGAALVIHDRHDWRVAIPDLLFDHLEF